MAVLVGSAAVLDREGGLQLLRPLLEEPAPQEQGMLARLRKVWVDSAYTGSFEDFLAGHGIEVEVVRRSAEEAKQMWVAPGEQPTPRVTGFTVLPHRWIVERTIAWLNRYRRLAKDYEARTDIAESWILVASVSLMLHRITDA